MKKYQVKVSGTNGLGLNIRSGAGTSFDKIGLIAENGWLFTVEEQKNGWYKLSNQKGYVSAKYVKIVKDLDPNKTTTVKPAPIFEEKKSDTGPNYKTPLNDSPPRGPKNTQGFFGIEGEPGDSDAQDIVVPIDRVSSTYYNDYSNMKNIMKVINDNHNTLTDPADIVNIRNDMFHRFNRFKLPYPDLEVSKTFAYIFFLRPDLNFFEPGSKTLREEIRNEPYFWLTHQTNPSILSSLNKSAHSTVHDFLPLLTNRALTFEVQDEYIKTEEDGETFTGFKVKYGRSDIESKTAGSFSVQFQEDDKLSVTKTIKSWTTYISKVYRGEFSPQRDYMLYEKILDYASAVYYILCGADGETILFWTKYYGIFPTSVNTSQFSYSKGNMVKTPELSINFDYSMKEDFNPIAIYEFNQNSRDSYIYKTIDEPYVLASTGRTMAGAPFIETYKNGNDYRLKLKFRT